MQRQDRRRASDRRLDVGPQRAGAGATVRRRRMSQVAVEGAAAGLTTSSRIIPRITDILVPIRTWCSFHLSTVMPIRRGTGMTCWRKTPRSLGAPASMMAPPLRPRGATEETLIPSSDLECLL